MRLQDTFGRRFPYLRLSITEACNFHCSYCLPNGYQKTGPSHFLDSIEVVRLARAFTGLGVTKIRLTGGEPTVRRDLTEIAAAISPLPGLQTIALTTNGYNLKTKAAEYRTAGINALNVSIDSLDPTTFTTVTGHDRLDDVLAGIDAAKAAGFHKIKINSVLLKGVTDNALPEFLAWIKKEALSVRFIELMQTGENQDYFRRHHLSTNFLREKLLDYGFLPYPRGPEAGPAEEFSHPEYLGKIGLIAPYAKNFCNTCNRLRVTARGKLMLCLFGTGSHDLRPLLQQDDQLEPLQETILQALHFKRESHYLQQGITGITPHLASLGG